MIERFTHIGHVVRDINKGIELYTAGFGFRPHSKGVMSIPGGKAFMVAVGNNLIEIIEPTDSKHRVGRFLEKRGEGLFHISFRVDDLDSEVHLLRERGLRLENPREITTLPTCPKISFVDPDSTYGAIIELAEEPAGYEILPPKSSP